MIFTSRSNRCLCLLLLGLSALATIGCTTPYRAIPLDSRDHAHNKPFKQDRNGLVLAATLIDDDSEAEELFFHPLPSRNVIPVVLHLENTGSRSMAFQLERVRLVLENGVELSPASASQVIDESKQDMWPAYAGAPFVFPYFMTRRDIEEFNFDLMQDYRSKALPPFLRITPQDPPSSRVLFFRVEEDMASELRNSPILQVPVDFESLAQTNGGDLPGKREFFHLALD